MLANAEDHAPVAMLPAAKEMIASDTGALHIHRASPPSTVQESEESASEADNEAEVEESTPRGGAIQSPTTYAEAAAVPAGTEAKVRGEEDDVAETPRVAPKELQKDSEPPKQVPEQAPEQPQEPSTKLSPQPSAPARVPTPPSAPSREHTATPPSRPSSSFPGAAFPGSSSGTSFPGARAGSATPPAMTRSSSSTSAPLRDDSSAAGTDKDKGETKGERRRKRLSSIKGFVRRMSDQGKPSLSRSNSQTGSARSYESEGERSKRNSTDAKRNSMDAK